MIPVNHTDSALPLIERDPKNGIPFVILTVIAMLLGTIGNLTIIITLFLNKKIQLAAKEFIINLAFSDLIVTAFANPLCIVGVIRGEDFFASRPTLCVMIASACLSICISAFLSLTLLTFHRFVYICHQRFCLKFFTTRAKNVMCLGIWVAAVLFELPNHLEANGHLFDQKVHSCVWNRLRNHYYTYFVGIGLITLPLIAMMAMYLRILYAIVKSKKAVAKNYQMSVTAVLPSTSESSDSRSSSQLSKSMMKNNHVLKSFKTSWSVFVVFIMSIICWTPYTIVLLTDFEDSLSLEVHLWVTWLAHLHSAVNCIIYCSTNSNFRQTVFKVFVKSNRNSDAPKIANKGVIPQQDMQSEKKKTCSNTLKIFPMKLVPREAVVGDVPTTNSLSDSQWF